MWLDFCSPPTRRPLHPLNHRHPVDRPTSRRSLSARRHPPLRTQTHPTTTLTLPLSPLLVHSTSSYPRNPPSRSRSPDQGREPAHLRRVTRTFSEESVAQLEQERADTSSVPIPHLLHSPTRLCPRAPSHSRSMAIGHPRLRCRITRRLQLIPTPRRQDEVPRLRSRRPERGRRISRGRGGNRPPEDRTTIMSRMRIRR